MISVSVVSHGHGPMVTRLLHALLALPEVGQVLLTLNRPEPLSLPNDHRLTVIRNRRPQGFGRNHNQAFQRAREPLFCVLNPDVILGGNPFPRLIETLHATDAGAVAPLVRNTAGVIQPSARRFQTLPRLARKLLRGEQSSYPLQPDQPPRHVDWVAGLFMLVRTPAYRAVGGFDEGYFLYYEDVDLCARLWAAGHPIALDSTVSIVHDAQYRSHRDPTHFYWHLGSLLRYLRKHRGGAHRP